MFQHDRIPPASWQRELESIVPRSGRIPWLLIAWQPGMPYEPVQRWELYEMMPRLEFVPWEIRQCLKGPSPRADGEWITDRRVPARYGSRSWLSSSLVTYKQWQLYQETGCYAARFWVIQGALGGHKFKLSAAERNFLQAMGCGEGVDTPVSGDLAYAEWDARVRAKVIEHDRLRRWKLTTPWDGRQSDKTRAGLYVRRDRKAEEERFAFAMLRYLETQVADVVSDLPRRVAAALMADAPRRDLPTRDEDALDRELVTDTATQLED